MHSTLRNLLLAGVAAFALAAIVPSAAPARDIDDDYWQHHWKWYNRGLRGYYPRGYYGGYGAAYRPYYGGPGYYNYGNPYGYGYGTNLGYYPGIGIRSGRFGFRLWY